MHYLLVDDDEVLCTVLERALTRRGYTVRVAHTIESALDACENQNFDRAIVDLKLNDESGLQLIERLKQKQHNIKIVMLTGYSSIATTVEAMKRGAVNYLCKPADTEEILAAFNDDQSDVSIPDTPPSVDRLEWEHIQKVLSANDGNISATARALGMHRRTLQRKLQKRPVKR